MKRAMPFARRAACGLLCVVLCAGSTACASLGFELPFPKSTRDREQEVYRRAEEDKTKRLESEVRRLRADLDRAEEALVAAESGLRSSHSRADAVSSLAETRIQVERAARAAPWRAEEIAEARAKLTEADSQVKAGYFGSAMFFVYRAERIAAGLQREAGEVSRTPGTRFVLARRANLRLDPTTDASVVDVLGRGTPLFPEGTEAGWLLVRTPAGAVGWIYAELVSEPATTTRSLPASLAR